MKNTLFKISLILLFLSNCGYSPIYSVSNKNEININIVSLQGDKNINNLLFNKLKNYKNEKSDKNYQVKIISKYDKKILTKNTTGDPTNYRLILDVNIIAIINENKIEINFDETFDMKKGNTTFEEETYEKQILQNMIDSIVSKFVSRLAEIQ